MLRWTAVVVCLGVVVGCGEGEITTGPIDAPQAIDDAPIVDPADGSIDGSVDAETDAAPPCGSDPDCDDGLACNGAEQCDVASGVCSAGPPAADGVVCDADANLSTRDVCIGSACVASICGDMFVDPGAGEICD